MIPTLYLAVPCYNEELVIKETAKRLKVKLSIMMEKNRISRDSKIVFIDDGSKDKTWEDIKILHDADPIFCGIALTRNEGHQNAVLAGLMSVREQADIVISLDADLQDDIGVLDDFVKAYQEGNDIVYGVRSDRKNDGFFKRNTALVFYKIMKSLGVDIVYNHADYRLMSSRALEGLSEFKEVNLFLRGIVPLVGYKSATVTYQRKERFAGESKYPLKKMMKLAVDGITSFSLKPISMISSLGGIMTLVSGLLFIWMLIAKLAGFSLGGLSSLELSIWCVGGLQLLALGVLGEYIGRIYLETKGRPKYIIKEYIK